MSPSAKILLIEDDSALMTTLHLILVGKGYEVVAEKTGDDDLIGHDGQRLSSPTNEKIIWRLSPNRTAAKNWSPGGQPTST